MAPAILGQRRHLFRDRRHQHQRQCGDFSADGIGTTGFNYYAALHEIGHALGLSHPFDGGSTTGATLDLSKDYSRNTVMSYVQTDRSKVFSVIDNGDGTFSQSTENVYASTPGMLDIDFMEAVYGAETNSSRSEGDNIYSSPTACRRSR